jgi:hypothetical protein
LNPNEKRRSKSRDIRRNRKEMEKKRMQVGQDKFVEIK